MTPPEGPLEALARLLDDAGLAHALIGGHAVNAWLEPRFTADIDVTVLADAGALQRLRAALFAAGYRVVREVGAGLPSGPDFVRFQREPGDPPIDIQAAKTALQVEVIRRGRRGAAPIAIATPEDLVVLKLIANRPKDLVDLRGLLALPDLDWDYIRRWAAEWEVEERLGALLGP